MSCRGGQVVEEEFGRRRAGELCGIGGLGRPRHPPAGHRRAEGGIPAGHGRRARSCGREGYTEPDSGSDLASLRTRAELDGDEWVISGQKTFCTAGHHCNWIIIAARTDPDSGQAPSRGSATSCRPWTSPGIELRPMYNLADGRQNMVYLDELRVPRRPPARATSTAGGTRCGSGSAASPSPCSRATTGARTRNTIRRSSVRPGSSISWCATARRRCGAAPR